VLVIDGDFVGRKTTQGFRAQNQDGLYESLEERNIGDRVIQATPFLHVLPAGRATPADACSITTGGIRQALEQLKGFDIVLIDSGPILESLEAGVLAQEVDGVILAISRGQQSDLVAQAVHRFQALGARLVGAVFNRANSQDFQCAAEPSPKLPLAGKGALVEMSELQRSVTNFGPVVRAVAMTISASS
jgi:Mrp family chromosome partitioning ATPase